MYRADARARNLPGLLARLPATPANTLVRKRRGGERPDDHLGREVVAALDEPLLLSQLVARMLVDDDLLIDRALRLGEGKALLLQARASLAPPPREGQTFDPRLAAVVREVLARSRGAAPAEASLSAVVVAAAGDGVQFVTRLGSPEGSVQPPQSPGGSTGLASRTLDLGGGARLCLLAIRPEALSRGALEGILSRLDALILLRGTGDTAELSRLQQFRAVVRAGADREPLTIGVDLGAGLRDWGEYPDAVLGLTDWEERPSGWLVERLVDALLAATAARPA